MRTRTLLLFDVDGVLIRPIGYKQALIATLDTFATQMGAQPVGLTFDEIAVFESLGMTNEWLSGPLCLGAMLINATTDRPELAQATLDETLKAIRAAEIEIPRPDFTGLARMIVTADPAAAHEAGPVLAMLGEIAPEALRPVLAELLGQIRPPAAPVGRVIQHFTLGSKRYQDTYGLEPLFEATSTLVEMDKPGMSPETTARLSARLARRDGLAAAIFTARPTLPPRELPAETIEALDRALFAPEGELAVEAMKLYVTLPLIGLGRVSWLAAEHGKDHDAYVKPSFVQALAAIGAAQQDHELEGLHAAAALAEHDELTGPLASLADQQTTVVVFEDSAGGIQAGRKAVEMLKSRGIDIRYEPIGIAAEPAKQAALARIADRVEETLDEALEPFL